MQITLGIRLAVGQQTLDLLGQVRILDPQPFPLNVLLNPNLYQVMRHHLAFCQ